MDDAEFLASVADLLREMIGDDLTALEVRPNRDRAWLRAEARFRLRGLSGSAFAPLDEDWRYLSGYERVDDYARLLSDRIWSAAREVESPQPRPTPATGPEEIASRWRWLVERLALNGRVVEQEDGSVRVVRPDGGELTVVVTPEQWARIAEPLDPASDDPQDFNQLNEDETFLVFHEDALEWSMRAELPPVPFGGEIMRSMREARERGEDMSRHGWFAADPTAEGSQ